jgi:flagellar hook assembly protein FlgD
VVSIGPELGADEQETPGRPGQFKLYPNSPNPFNKGTNISFTIPGDGSHPVSLRIYNITGQEILTLMEGDLGAGRHTIHWNGCDASGRPLASGMYLCRLQSGRRTETIKMMMVN